MKKYLKKRRILQTSFSVFCCAKRNEVQNNVTTWGVHTSNAHSFPALNLIDFPPLFGCLGIIERVEIYRHVC